MSPDVQGAQQRVHQRHQLCFHAQASFCGACLRNEFRATECHLMCMAPSSTSTKGTNEAFLDIPRTASDPKRHLICMAPSSACTSGASSTSGTRPYSRYVPMRRSVTADCERGMCMLRWGCTRGTIGRLACSSAKIDCQRNCCKRNGSRGTWPHAATTGAFLTSRQRSGQFGHAVQVQLSKVGLASYGVCARTSGPKQAA